MNTNDLVRVAAIAPVAATEQDIAVVVGDFPNWLRKNDGTPLYVTDESGEFYVRKEDEGFIVGFLLTAAMQRKDARVARADAALVDAYDALRSHPKVPQAATDKMKWQSTMLRLFAAVTAALLELVDAKTDAKTMGPARANRIRSDAASIQRAAETNVHAALRQALRAVRS